MAQIEFDINRLYADFFSSVKPPFPQATLKTPDPKPINKDDFNSVKYVQDFYVKLGTPLKPKAMFNTYFRLPCALRIPESGKQWVVLPNEPIISINANKDIVITTLNRGTKRGSVKEEINLEDYRINIQGLIINFDVNEYPDEEVKKLRELFEYSGPLEVDNYLLGLFGINMLIMTSLEIPREEKMTFRIQPYTIRAISDEDFELEILTR